MPNLSELTAIPNKRVRVLLLSLSETQTQYGARILVKVNALGQEYDWLLAPETAKRILHAAGIGVGDCADVWIEVQGAKKFYHTEKITTPFD